MELKLEQGDYVPDGAGGFETLDGAQALLARVLFRLTARRGQFPFLPEMGSRLYLLGRERPSAREAPRPWSRRRTWRYWGRSSRRTGRGRPS